jgi:PhzF family phenazine biosynthesis protein
LNRRVRVFLVDAFTGQLFAGNPAGVVLDAEHLDDGEMQSIGRELGGIDTAFVLPPDAGDHDLRVRFFTPRGETGFVGHATIAVQAVFAALQLRPGARQKQRSGSVEVGRMDASGAPLHYFAQPPPPLQGPLAADTLLSVLGALGVESESLDPACPAVLAGERGSRALLAVRDGALLAQLRPDLARLAALSAAGGPGGFFLYTRSPALAGCDTEARMFCPALGIAEDPVSGNAHAMLAAHLHALGRMPAHAGGVELTGCQGHHLGRPGTVQVRLELEGQVLRRVQVAGRARIVFATTIELATARAGPR